MREFTIAMFSVATCEIKFPACFELGTILEVA